MKNLRNVFSFFLALIGLMLSNPLAAQWNQIYSGNTGTAIKMHMGTNGTGYLFGISTVYKTTNYGVNWIRVDSVIGSGNGYDYHVNGSNVYVLRNTGSGYFVRYSNNSGSTWASTSIITTSQVYGVNFINATTGVVAGNNGIIYRTTNGGASWSFISSGTSNTLYDVDFANATVGYIAGWNGTVLKTTNAGASWTSLSTGLLSDFIEVECLNQDSIYVGGFNELAFSGNAGVSFQTKLNTNYIFQTIEVPNRDTIYAYSPNSGKLFRSTDKGLNFYGMVDPVFGNGGDISFLSGKRGFGLGPAGVYETNNAAFGCADITTGSTINACPNANANMYSSINAPTPNSYNYSWTPLPNINGASNQYFAQGFVSNLNDSINFMVVLTDASGMCPNDTAWQMVKTPPSVFVPTYTMTTNILQVCAGDTIHLGPGAQSYSWYSQPGNVLVSSNEYLVVTQSMIGSGQIQAMVGACNAAGYLFFFQQSSSCGTCNLNVSLGNNVNMCGYVPGTTYTLSPSVSGATGAVTYNWIGNGIVNTTAPIQTVSNVYNQQYIVQVSDASGCSDADTIVVTEINSTMDSVYACNFPVTIGIPPVLGSPMVNYYWNNTFPTVSTPTLIVNSPGQYVNIAMYQGACAVTSVIHVVDTCNSACTLVATAMNINNCASGNQNPQVVAMHNGNPLNVIVQWTPASMVNNPNIINPVITQMVYNQPLVLTVTDTVTNCVATYTISVTNLYTRFDTIYNCNGSAATITMPPGANIYQWMSPFTNVSPTQNSAIITNPGVYMYVGLYNGCAVTNQTTLIDSCTLLIPNVWPGDCNYDLGVDYVDFLNINMAYGNVGATRPSASLAWAAQPMVDWGTASYFTDDKHADCDGNGIVDINDALAINQNYNMIHPFRYAQTPSKGASVNPKIKLLPSKLVAGLQEQVDVDIVLGDASLPLNNIYAIAFQVRYEDSLTKQVGAITYMNTWMGNPMTDLISFEKEFHAYGRVDAAVGGNNQIGRNGHGTIGRLGIVTTDNLSGIAYLHFNFTNVYAITVSGQQLPLDLEGDSILIDPNFTGVQTQTLSESDFTVFPNPANTVLNVESLKSGLVVSAIEMHDALGRVVGEWNKGGFEYGLNVSQYDNGIYTISIQTNEGVVKKKIQIQR